MTADLRVAVYPADESACGHYRCIFPARFVNEPGVEVLIGDDAPDLSGEWSGPWDPARKDPPAWVELRGVHKVPDVDVVVIQRPLSKWRADLVGFLQAAGVAVVVEIDDDFSCIHPDNPAFLPAEPAWWPAEDAREYTGHANLAVTARRRVGGKEWFRCDVTSPSSKDNIARACRQADLVTCTTEALASRYAPHGRVAVIPNFIPEAYLTTSGARCATTRVGWSGSVQTHPGDLDEAAAVGILLDRNGARFSVIGSGEGVGKAMGCAVEATGWVPFDAYPTVMAGLDVGVCPLRDSAFNRAKSWLKPLEMSALGVAWVASDVPEYRRLRALGAGVLAANRSQWRKQVGRLIGSEQARTEQVEANRQVAATLTYERNAWRWAQAWTTAAQHRVSRMVAA